MRTVEWTRALFPPYVCVWWGGVFSFFEEFFVCCEYFFDHILTCRLVGLCVGVWVFVCVFVC